MNIGLIGYTEGNGHPYSFSSIINGYNRKQYPAKWQVILNYLDSKPSVDFIKGHKITHIYCEDYSESLLIAASSNIPNVCNSFHDLSDCDAILILLNYSPLRQVYLNYFLEIGKYIFVDKPVAASLDELDKYRPYMEAGQLVSSSSLCYAYELDLFTNNLLSSQLIVAYSPSDILHYAIHVLQPILYCTNSEIISFHASSAQSYDSVHYLLENGQEINLICGNKLDLSNQLPLQLSCKGSGPIQSIVFKDNFTAFKRHLSLFLDNYMTYPFHHSYVNVPEYLIKSNDSLGIL